MTLLTHLLIYNLLVSVVLMASLAYNPRTWLHRMPPEVVQKVTPRTPAEKRLLWVSGMPFLLLLLVYPLVYVLQHNAGWVNNFLTLCAFFAGFAVWDTLVLDLLIFCTLTPRFVMVPGTTRQDYANKRYHLVSGAKGVLISLIFSVILATLLTWVG